MVMFHSLTFLLGLSVLAFSSANVMTWRGKHSFPLVDEFGKQLANEFQLLRPQNIRKRSEVANTTGIYEILEVFPRLITNDEIVTVKFFTNAPSTGDWIGAYAPADVPDITATVPVKYGWCDEDPNYMTNGFGALTFNLTNLRSDVGFYYFTNKLSHPILMTSSPQTVQFKNLNQQLRPRVVASGDPNVLKLLWSSNSSKRPIMKWGTSSGKYDHIVFAETSRIDQSQMCGSPASTYGWRDMGLIHTAKFEGMAALATKKVYYVFGDEETHDFHDEIVLTVPPLAGQQPADRPTSVILFDDLGRGTTDMTYTWNEYGRPSMYTAMVLGAEVAAGTVDGIYHGGDISYATGYEAVWDFFLDMIAPMASGTIYLTTVGNHESDYPGTPSYYQGTDSGGECGVSTTVLIPPPAPATTNKPWWSYDIGLIHFIGMSTEHDYTIGSEQYNWLENDLKSVDRSVTPWVIFGGHRAMYINSNYGGAVTSDIVVMDNMIANLENLLFKYKVNIGFYGHNHVVNRQSAVYNKTVIQHAEKVTDADGNTIFYHDNPQATVQMVIGTGGADFTKNAVSPGPDWNELFFYRWGYTRVTAVNATYLDWKWFDSQTGELVDHMVITQRDISKPWVLPDGTSSQSVSKNLRGVM